MNCPKCGLTQADQSTECPRCGVIFAKIGLAPLPPSPEAATQPLPDRSQRLEGLPTSRRATVPPLPVPDPGPPPHEADLDDWTLDDDETERLEPRVADRTDWLMVAAGAGLAALALVVPFVKNTFSAMLILVHEMGHCIFGWLFGYPSFPAFDFVYGGGITFHGGRSLLLLGVEYALLAVALYVFRANISALIFLVVLAIAHAACAFTSAHQVVILFMGHGTELAIAALFLYRALSGAAVVHTAERPLYAAVGLFIVFYDLAFAYGLVTQPLQRALYEGAKGGGHWMDFSRIAEEYLQTKLSAVAFFFLLCTLLPIPVGFLMFRYQDYLRSAIARLASR